MKIFKVLGIFALVIVVVYISTISFILGLPIAEDYSSRINFESAVWKKAEGNDDKVRITMIDSLLSRYNLEGMSRIAINELLGVPEKTGFFADYEYVYWLGPQRGILPMDSEWLCLKFKDDVVTEAVVLAD